VWMVLVSGLVGARRVRGHRANREIKLINILYELLRNERQEEVLLLGFGLLSNAYDCFITLEDIVCGLGTRRTDPIFCELQDWPKYEGGGPRSKEAPTWIWEHWPDQTERPIAHSLRKLNAEDFKNETGILFSAVVSRKGFCEDTEDRPYFMLW
jgi:hypothetical protein